MKLNFEEMEGKKKIILKEGFDFRMWGREVINYIEQNYYLLIYCTISTIFSTLWIVVINVEGSKS